MSHAMSLRNRLEPGDIGEIVRLHGILYSRERRHGVSFEAYVAEGLADFHHRFDPVRERIWICEAGGRIVGTLFLAHREGQAQLRWFLVCPDYRGQGLGKRLMQYYMRSLEECGYARSFLWTTSELEAAASLYVRHGFRLAGEKTSDRFGKRLVEQKYEWRADG